MKFSTPKITIPSITFRLEIVLLAVLVYLIGACFLFGSCLKVTFTEGMSELQGSSDEPKTCEPGFTLDDEGNCVEEFTSF